MSINRYAVRRDRCEPAIVQALEAIGAKVLRLDAADLLVCYQQRLSLLDCKTGNAKPTAAQARLIAAGWPLRLVRTIDDAFRVIGAAPRLVSPEGSRREESA